MYEIYDAHAVTYDELVDREDARGELANVLKQLVLPGMRVLEAGAGTGRVTALYADRAARVTCCDRSAHMLSRARERLAPFADRLEFRLLDNLSLADACDWGPFDVVLEGWSFGHTVADRPGEEAATCDALVAGARASLAPGGRVVIIETLGTHTATAGAPRPYLARFYERLEAVHGFERHVLRTDYRFPDVEEARRVMGFFFGAEMAARVTSADVPEWTGVWVGPR